MPKIDILNIQIDNLYMLEALDQINHYVQEKKNAIVVTPNIDHIVMVDEDPKLREVYQHADLVLTDGQPIIWISKIVKKPIKEKCSGSDMLPKICELAANNHQSIFFLGAAEGVAQMAAERLCEKFNELIVAGVYSPSYQFEKDPTEIAKILRLVKQAKPDILVVALGSPKGEKFIYQYKEELGVPVSLSFGAAIDFQAGTAKRAPSWMSKIGFEWLYRLVREPKRLAKRYFKDFIKIIPIIIKYCTSKS